MTKREIGVLICRVLALYAVLQSLQYLTGLSVISNLLLLEHGMDFGELARQTFTFASAFFPFAISVAAAAVLWYRAEWIAARMVGGEQVPAGEAGLSAARVQAMAFSVVGLFFLVRGLVGLSSRLGVYAFAPELSEPFSRWVAAALLADLARSIIGLVLLLGARGLVNIVRTIRTAGHEKK